MTVDNLVISEPVLVVAGPTAIGKTALSLELVRRFQCEIVSMDSVQVYRYMDIGSAKPTPEERALVPHHLIDIVDPNDQYNAAIFVKDCSRAVCDIIAKGRLPLITGGTGLYLKALLDGLFEEPPSGGLSVRGKILSRLATEGLAALYHELQHVDPESASRIHPHDRQRIVRGLEIYYATSIPWSEHLRRQKQTRRHPSIRFERLLLLGLDCERQVLYRRIEDRAHQMIDQGLIEETEKLRSRGYGPDLPSMQTLGYRHANRYLDGDWDREQMIARLVRDTRRYAKRQLTWFRRQVELSWFAPDDIAGVVSQVQKHVTG